MTTHTKAESGTITRLAPRENTDIGLSLFRLALRRLRRDKLTLLAMGVLLLLTTISMLAPGIAGWLNLCYTCTEVTNNFQPIGTPGHFLGTDDLGRDHFIRLLYAGQVSLMIAFIAGLLSLGIGVSLGVLTGYFGGIVDDVTNWLITTLNSIPQFFLLLILSAVLSPGPLTLVLILGFLGWTGTMRLVRGETLALREREYIISARAIGSSAPRVMFVHIVPNLFSIVVVTLAIDIGSLILTESALSFLGLGVKPPTPTWGNMLTDASTFFTLGGHLVVMPGLLITVTVLCLYVIGDGLRDAFDPTTVD
jgi:peptide/nickel transport system permease protein